MLAKFKKKFASGHPHLRICTHTETSCLDRIFNAMDDPTSSLFKSCHCLDDCNKMNYFFSSSTTVNKMSAAFLQNYTSTGDYALESEISIFFSDNEFFGFKRVLRSNRAVLFSQIGAFLWLFLGASALSIVETVYFFTLRFFNNLWIVNLPA